VDGSYTTQTVEGGALETLSPPTAPPTTDTLAAAPDGSVLYVEGNPARLWNPAMAASAAGAAPGGTTPEHGAVVAPMHGTILKVLVAEGDAVQAGDPVAILEAMKMETHLAASGSGTIRTVAVRPGDVVEAGQAIVVLG
jgi:biotin carboxyl carrier protein